MTIARDPDHKDDLIEVLMDIANSHARLSGGERVATANEAAPADEPGAPKTTHGGVLTPEPATLPTDVMREAEAILSFVPPITPPSWRDATTVIRSLMERVRLMAAIRQGQELAMSEDLARIAALEAEVELILEATEHYGYLDRPTPAEIAARVAQNRKEQE